MEQAVIEKALSNITMQAFDGLQESAVDGDRRMILALRQTILNFFAFGDEDMTFAIRFVDNLIEEFNS